MKETYNEYAEALFILGAENGRLDAFSENLREADRLIEENPDYLEVLDSPAIPLSERLSAIDEAFSGAFDEYIVSFLKLMCENNHIRELRESIKEFSHLLMSYQNRTVATVYYAQEPPEEQKTALSNKLSKISGKTVEANYIKDASLLGGIKVLLDDKTLDGSIKGRLNKVKGMISE